MSDAFEQWAEDKSFILCVSSGDGYINVKEMAREAWQSAQAQAVNQQVLEALKLLYEAAGSIKADEHMLKNYPKLLGAVRVADTAIAAAQEQSK